MKRSLCAFLVMVAVTSTTTAKSKSEDVHVPTADCAHCHTAGRADLEAKPGDAPHQIVPDVEQRCTACHDEGPSHRTGMKPRGSVPVTLPLADGGLIGCATCHFMHGEKNPYGDFVRLDNSRGGLCLSCHKLEELQ